MSIFVKIGLICMVVGAVIVVGVGVVNGFNFCAIAESNTGEETYEIQESFNEIDIENASGTIRVEKSQDNVCRVVCMQSDDYGYDVYVKNGELKIKGERRGFFGFMDFGTKDMYLNLYLPEEAYSDIEIETASGDATIAEGLSFCDVDMEAASGCLTFNGIADELEAKCASGEIIVNGSVHSAELSAASGNITVNGDVHSLKADSTSGDVTVTSDVSIVRTSSVSGNVCFNGMNADSINASTTSGNVKFIDSDARTINVKTTSGDVTGTLLTDKIFNIQTTSGDVETPRSVSGGGECDIQTTSGDVDIDVK